MRTAAAFLMAVAVCGWVVSAQADWDPQNPDPDTKWVQLPDWNGWDVNAVSPNVLADDFLCTETGVITDVHLWGSWKGDRVGDITNITVAFLSDVPATDCDYSQPGELLWKVDIDPYDCNSGVQIRPYGEGDQGWYSPAHDWYSEDDHEGIWQVNILLDDFLKNDELFHQEEGNVYWLAVSVETAWPDGQAVGTDGFGGDDYPPKFGWKTSVDHWNDDAVWGVLYDRSDSTSDGPFWHELVDPTCTESLDLAFVLTGTPDNPVPEPGILAIFGFGIAGLLVKRRRK